MSDVGRNVVELLNRRRPDGVPVFADAAVREVIPLLAAGIARDFPGASFSDFVFEAVGDVVQKAGIDDNTPASELWPALERYYENHPNPLIGELNRILRSAGATNAQDRGRALGSLLGVETSRAPLGGVRPAGTVPAGPAARFAALKAATKI
jgi:hypothetical protein